MEAAARTSRTQRQLQSHPHVKPRFDERQHRAEEIARQLVAAIAEHGRGALHGLDLAQFPTSPLAGIAERTLAATDAGARGFSDVMIQSFMDAPDHIRALFIECSEGFFPPRAEHCKPLADALRTFHAERRKREIADSIRKALDQGDDIDAHLAELAKLETAGTGKSGNPFPITLAAEIEEVAEARDFVERLLTEAGASVVYGASNTAKTFWTLDLSAAVATGRPFRDELETEQGAVVYVALEGNFGIRNRILAMRRAGKLADSSPLYLCFAPLNLLEAGHAGRLAETVKQVAAQSEMPCRLVVIDTMARAMAGGDENKAADMTAAVAAIDAVRAATGAHVAIVHHTGKDEAKGARGHSSLRAAVDTEIEVFRPEGESVSTVRITKQRDMPLGESMPFSLKVIELGTDRRGNPITSCIVKHEDQIMAASRGKTGRPPAATDEELLSLLPAASTAAWQKVASDELGVSKSAFHRALKHLQGHGAMKGTGGNWIRS